ncbi:MAG TPA: rhomboid family intramembrane serine protease [Chroococcales cyanobacterium]
MFPFKDNLRCKLFPLATVAIIVLNCLAFVVETIALQNSHDNSFLTHYTLVPASFVHAFVSANHALMGWAIVTIFTSMFLHGGLMHIVGNMVFLFVFGPAVENRLGRARFVYFYLAAGIAAALAQVASGPASQVPTLGASGAIAGVLGAYLIFWPKAEITILIPPLFAPARMRAVWFLIAWFVMQLYPVAVAYLLGSDGEKGGVAYFEHIGGFLLGLVVAIVVRIFWPKTDVCYVRTACPCPSNAD